MDADRLDPDLTEALARGREPRKLWPVLHSVEDTTQEPRGVEPWAVFVVALMLVIVVSSFARCVCAHSC